MNTTDNFDLKVYEGDDLFNPLTVENANTEAIDEQLFKNQNAGIQVATELLTQNVHAITRNVPDASMFRFTAVSRFSAGDVFEVDGVQVTALTTSGEQLPDGAYVIGSEVLCVLKGTVLTVFISTSSLNTAKNAEKLGGQLPTYYATAGDLADVAQIAQSAGELAEGNTQEINALKGKLLWTNPSPSSPMSADTVINLSSSDYDYLKILWKPTYNGNVFLTTDVDKESSHGVMFIANARANYSNAYSRSITKNSDIQLTVNIGYEQATNVANPTTTSNVCVPYKIYGCKY